MVIVIDGFSLPQCGRHGIVGSNFSPTFALFKFRDCAPIRVSFRLGTRLDIRGVFRFSSILIVLTALPLARCLNLTESDRAIPGNREAFLGGGDTAGLWTGVDSCEALVPVPVDSDSCASSCSVFSSFTSPELSLSSDSFAFYKDKKGKIDNSLPYS